MRLNTLFVLARLTAREKVKRVQIDPEIHILHASAGDMQRFFYQLD